MRAIRPSFPILLTFVVAPALGVFLHSTAFDRHLGLRTAVLIASTESDAELFARGVEQFEAKLYREALALFDATDAAKVDARAWRFYREAAALRLAVMQGEDTAQRRAVRGLEALADEDMDAWGARAAGELIRAGMSGDSEVSRLLELALRYWEQSADVDRAVEEYGSLLTDWLTTAQDRGGVAPPALRMWENLVAIGAPREDLEKIAAHLLAGRVGAVPLPREQNWRRVIPPVAGDRDALVRTVATDVLSWDVQPWLAAAAQWRLGESDENRGDLRSAAEHYRAAIDLADPSDSWAADQARERLEALLKPVLEVSGPALYRPGSEHPLQMTWRNLDGWTLDLRRVDVAEDLELPEGQRGGSSLNDFFPMGAGSSVLQRSQTDEEERAARASRDRQKQPHQYHRHELWLDPLPAGVYVAEFTGQPSDEDREKARARVAFHVTDLGVVFQPVTADDAREDRLELWLLEMQRGEPQAGVSLTLHTAIRSGRALQWRSEPLRTDADGIARIPVDAPPAAALLTGQVGDRPVLAFHARGGWPRHHDEGLRGLVITDRPLYRPGETVQLQSFVRERNVRERRSAVPDRARVEMIVTAPDGSEFRRESFDLDANGAFETRLDLPEQPPLGAYSVRLRMSDRDLWVASGTFQVDEYRLPEFTVSASLDDDLRYVLGDTLEVDVAAEYLFGGPVRGQAEIVVTRQPLWIWYQPYGRYDWLREAKAAPFWGGQEEVLRLARPLDADGRVTFRIPTSLQAHDLQDYSYTVQARVTDSSRREEQGSTTVKVTRQELYAYLTSTRYLLAPGAEARLRLRVQDAMGRPAQVAGRWWVERMLEKGGTEELLSRNTQTASDGETELVFTPQKVGYYQIHFATQDARGNEVTAETTVWCADPKTKTITHAEGGLQLIAERDAFLEDEVAKVLLVSDVAGAPVHLSRHFAGIVQTQVLRMKGTVELLEIPITRLHRPYFYVQAASARDFLLRQATVQVVAPLAEQSLSLDVRFDEASYLPGEKAMLRIRARDGLGQPVQGPVTVAVVDEAVLALLPRELMDPDQVFNRYDTPHPRDLYLAAGRFGGYADRDRNEVEISADRTEASYELEESSMAYGGGGPPLAAMEADGAMAVRQKSADVSANMARAPAPAPMPSAPATLRTDFRTTALWRTAVVTDADGAASIEVPLAESLTRWEALAVSVTPDSKAGMSTTTTRTRKDVMVRLNHPRVFRERDRFLFAATVHNETSEDLVATVSLEAQPLRVSRGEQSVTVAAHGQAQVEWWAEVPAGSASLEFVKDAGTGRVSLLSKPLPVRVTALTKVDSDAFERSVELLAHGTDLRVVAALEASSGTSTLAFTLPRDRLTSAETALLTLSPSVLTACLDALPFLADFPYGCTEQTLSRFVPAVAVRSVTQALGVPSRRIDPKLDEKIEAGLRRIADAQHGDGGWGWWKEDDSRASMTAYVLVALGEAQESGVRVDRDMLQRGRDALRAMLPSLEPSPDDMAYALYALSCADLVLDAKPDDTMARYANVLLERRDNLHDYARALLALTLHRAGSATPARLVLDHLGNTAQREPKYQTTHWGKVSGYWWRGEGAIETTAFALKAMGEIAPDHRDFRPAARWLVLNREGNRWSSTRATAHAIYSLVDFARQAGELTASYTVVATLGGQEMARFSVEPKTLIDGGGEFVIPAELLTDGANQVKLTLEGTGVCYATLSVETYSQQEKPEPTEHFLGVRREIVRLRPQRTLGGEILQIEEPLAEGDAVASGDRLRVRLRLTAYNDLQYLAIEDPRPAGAEPVERLSGWFWGEDIGGRREVRDDRTAFFVSALPQGEHVLEYELRAESPGTFHVMPTRAYAMYVPDVNGSSGEDIVAIEGGTEEHSEGR